MVVGLILFIFFVLYIVVHRNYSMKNGVKRHVSLLKEKVAKFYLNETMWYDTLNMWLRPYNLCWFIDLLKSRHSRNIYQTQFSSFPFDSEQYKYDLSFKLKTCLRYNFASNFCIEQWVGLNESFSYP